MTPHITRFVRTCVQIAKESVVGRPSPALRRGEGGFADWVMLSILCLREREEETFRSVIDKLKVMGPIRAELGLELDDLPDPSTVCKAMERFTMDLFRRLLDESVTLFELGDVTALDASGFDRIAASRRYTRRTDYRFLAMKATLLTDCESGAILDIHCTTSRPHDTQIGWQVLTRNLDQIRTITADKGYDWADLRSMLRANGVRPLIKHLSMVDRDGDLATELRVTLKPPHRHIGLPVPTTAVARLLEVERTHLSWRSTHPWPSF